MSEEHIVHYFDVRGRAEPIRMILSYAGAKWKDQRIPYNTFPAVIPAEIKSGKCIRNTMVISIYSFILLRNVFFFTVSLFIN